MGRESRLNGPGRVPIIGAGPRMVDIKIRCTEELAMRMDARAHELGEKLQECHIMLSRQASLIAGLLSRANETSASFTEEELKTLAGTAPRIHLQLVKGVLTVSLGEPLDA